ncbi:tetratricopeptide repeat protein [Castellaniella ginsengisoli]|jgi:predicted negative regulator of RcsB-dependent stress response|uniref:Ancillary SecYEG translocon subunit n=2 Tax=Castellaniella TaxID=359336 RepID=A0AB39D781_9BURK
MAYDLEEQEKIDALKAWWERYGTLTMALIFAVMAAFAGWRGWQWYQTHQASQAMGYYEALESAAAQPGEDAVARIKAASEALRDGYAGSGYASRGVLVAAWALQERKDLDGAREQLEWLAGNQSAPALQAVARLRLAGVLLAQQQYEPALAQLEGTPPAGFDGLYADRRGDILAAQGRHEQAVQAWKEALTSLGADPAAQIVQLKIDALNGA